MKNKKIMYLVDYTLEEYNSVRDILYFILKSNEIEKYQNVIVKSKGNIYNPVDTAYSYGYKTYSFRSKNDIKLLDIFYSKRYTVFEKVECLYRRVARSLKRIITGRNESNDLKSERYLRKIVKKEKPDLIVFLDYSPELFNTDICTEYKIPFVSMLYDTYIGRPGIDLETALTVEKYTIENSKGYFIPNFFYDKYLKYYDCSNIKEYRLPLLIDEKDVLEAYKNADRKYEFAYFGQIQAFRNGDKIKNIFREIGITMDVFSTEKYESDDAFHIHPAITKEELYTVVAGSKYLVAFDNGAPYTEYLPSKAYLYVSFTKPVIAFGDNETSALKTFFKDYPCFYYQNINDSTDGLREFLKIVQNDGFNKEVYSKYSEYLPKNALKPFTELVDEILKSDK